MTKMRIDGNSYHTDRKRGFKPQPVSHDQLTDAMNFAIRMVYGGGHHRPFRTGGTIERKRGEKFCNTFQGKLAEIILHKFLTSHNMRVSELDFGIYGEGEWDEVDLIANGKKINIKSAAFFANLLLLEKGDWDKEGRYTPDNGKGEGNFYDFFVLVRFRPDVKSVFLEEKLLYTDDEIKRETLEGLLLEKEWSYDIPGCISNETLKKLIERDYAIPKGARLNGSIPMDATNYYIQTGDMFPLEDMMTRLNECEI